MSILPCNGIFASLGSSEIFSGIYWRVLYSQSPNVVSLYLQEKKNTLLKAWEKKRAELSELCNLQSNELKITIECWCHSHIVGRRTNGGHWANKVLSPWKEVAWSVLWDNSLFPIKDVRWLNAWGMSLDSAVEIWSQTCWINYAWQIVLWSKCSFMLARAGFLVCMVP